MNPFKEWLSAHLPFCHALVVAAGIGAGWLWRSVSIAWWWAAIGMLGGMALMLLLLHRRRQRVHSSTFGILWYIFLFILSSLWLVFRYQQAQVVWPSSKVLFRGVVLDSPQPTGRTIALPLLLMDYDSGGMWHPVRRKVRVTYLPDSIHLMWQAGDAVCCRGRVESPHNQGNPEEMDYASWLYRQGFSGTVFAGKAIRRLQSEDSVRLWRRAGSLHSLRWRAWAFRAKLSGQLAELQLPSQQTSLLQAMTLGDKYQLSHDTRQLFAEVGAAHVLALSGLHLGVLTFMLLLLLRPLRRKFWGRMLTALLLWLFIWWFALMAGLPVSLCRAALMYSFGLFFYVVRTRADAFNVWSWAAIVLLALQPMSLLDVGFQLSFLSVAGILLFRPCVDFLCPRNRLLAAMVSLACVAVAAQAATAPLVARYFHLFPVGFLLTNLVVVPCTYLLLGGALLHFSFSFVPVLQGITGNVLSVVAGFLCQSLELFAGWEWFSVAVYPSWLTVVLCYLLMGTLLYAFFCRSRRAVVVSFVTAVLLWINAFFMDGRVARQVIFFRSPASPSVLFVQDGGKAALWNTKGQLAAPVNRFLGEKGLPSPQMMGNLSESKGIVEFGPWRVVIFDAAHWQNIVTRRPLAVDVLYLSRRSLGGLTHWSELFQPKLVVVDASVRGKARQHLLEEIKTKGWPCHDMAVQGAYILR